MKSTSKNVFTICEQKVKDETDIKTVYALIFDQFLKSQQRINIFKELLKNSQTKESSYDLNIKIFEFTKNEYLKIPDLVAPEIEKMNRVIGHFYRIEDIKGKTRGYLLGTVHMMHRCIMDMNIEIKNAIAKSEHLFLEIKEISEEQEKCENRISFILDKLSKTELESVVYKYKKILKLHSNLLKNTTWEELEEKIRVLDPDKALKECRTQYAYVLAQKKGQLNSSNEIVSTVDAWVHEQYIKNNRPIYGLESVEEHDLALQEMFSWEDSALKNAIFNPDLEGNLNSSLEICKEWKKGTIPHLAHHEKETREYKLYEMRSHQFGEAICSNLTSNEHIGFYAFGLAHLYDSEGVIQKLQNRNFKVVRID